MENTVTIGAYALIRWEDTGQEENVYVSFSEWEDDATTDKWGVDDNEIFFYFPQGEQEMSNLNDDFRKYLEVIVEILSYETVSITETEGSNR
jgi:hypothetical protein